MEHHGSLTVPSSLTVSALLQGHPSQQSQKKEREKRRRPHPSLLPAALQCASSTNFSTVSAPRLPLTSSLKMKPGRPRRRRLLAARPIARDVSARVRQPLFLRVSLPFLSFVSQSIISFKLNYLYHCSPNTRIVRTHSHMLVMRSRPLHPTTSIPSLSILQHSAPHASRSGSALGAAGGTTSPDAQRGGGGA